MSPIHTVTRRPLSEFVEFMWISEGYARPHAAERILPTGNMALVLSLDERAGWRDVLSGAATRSFVLDISKPLSLIGVRFKPGGGFPFFAGPLGELQDLGVSLDTVWGREAQTLRQQLLDARTVQHRFQVMEDFLLQQVLRKPERNPAVSYAIDAFRDSGNALSVAEVRDRTGYSARRFIEMFRNEVGMTPKLFSRLARFRGVVRAVQSAPAVDWAATAVSRGYFDQAHFAHEFREFAGMSPAVYLNHRTANPNHVRVPGLRAR